MDVKCLQPMAGKILAGTATGLFSRTSPTSPWTATSLSMYQVLDMTQHGGYVMAALYGYVARSTDGQTWTVLPGTGLPPANTFAARHIVSNQGSVIINTLQSGNNLYKSVNNGDTWSVLPIPGSVTAGTPADFLQMVGDRMFTHYYGFGIFYSDDAGQTWHDDIASGSEFWYPESIEICNGTYVINNTSGILVRPVVGGTTWNMHQPGQQETYPLATTVFKYNGYLFMGTGGEGMYRIDTMLTSFQKINTGLVASRTEFIDGNNGRIIAYTRRQQDIWSSVDNGQNWTSDSITNYYINDVTSSTVNGNKWYVGLLGGINYSTDNGATWRLINTGLTNSNVYCMYTTSAGVVYAGCSDGEIYRCVNDTSWVLQPTTISDDESVKEIIEAGPHIFIGTFSAYPGTSHLYRTNSTFQNLQVVSGSWNVGFENVWGLVYQGNRLIAGSDGYGIFYSTDFGNSWDTINTGLNQYMVFKEMRTHNGRVYGTGSVLSGLYMLDSNSTEWECLTCDPGDPRAISVYITDTLLFVGTADNGVWKTQIPESVYKTTSKKTYTPLAYPNPGASPYIQFNKGDLTLPATLCVYDEVGKLCYKELINTYNYQLKQSQLKTGNYIIRITDKENREATVKWLKTN